MRPAPANKEILLERLLGCGFGADCALQVATPVLYSERLPPEEAQYLGTMVPARREEFAAGRTCARLALAKLDAPWTVIPRGANGAPLWSAGYVGSIRHCEGFCAAVVARSQLIAAVGVDAEQAQPLTADVSRWFRSSAEAAECSRLSVIICQNQRIV